MNISIGTKIRYMRKLNNLTQEQLAERLGTTKSAVGMWETDKRNPSTNMLHRIADVFNKDVSYFIAMNVTDGTEDIISASNANNLVMKAVNEFLSNGCGTVELSDVITSIELSDSINKVLSVDGEVLSENELCVLTNSLEATVNLIRIIRRG